MLHGSILLPSDFTPCQTARSARLCSTRRRCFAARHR
jgi:hypothetical protein